MSQETVPPRFRGVSEKEARYALATAAWALLVTVGSYLLRVGPGSMTGFLLRVVVVQAVLFGLVAFAVFGWKPLPDRPARAFAVAFLLLFVAFAVTGGVWGLLAYGYSNEFLAGVVYGVQHGVPAALLPALLAVNDT